MELIIGIFVGVVVVAGAVKIFTGSTKNSADNINISRLDQDLRSMMDIMVREIRRAGFATASADLVTFQNNVFSNINIEDININTAVYPKACITFMYNKDQDIPPVVDNNERLGFKLAIDTSFNPDKRLLRMWKGGADLACNNTNWETITSPDVEITNLRFDLDEKQINVRQRQIDLQNSPSSTVPSPPPACNAADKCQLIRNVTITLTGAIRAPTGTLEAWTTHTITDTVRIRNDQYCENGVASTSPGRCN
jgi:prepilin peptidase dependent protein B